MDEWCSDGQQPRRPCSFESSKREECHSIHGKQGEDCVREELTEKRCLAELFCPQQATKFYREPLRRGSVGGGYHQEVAVH